MIFVDHSRLDRRKTHLDRDHVCEVTSPHVISERNESGRASLECVFEGPALRFKLDGGDNFPGLSTRKCADAVLVLDPWGTAPHIHIIELKRTVKPREWEEIKQQFYGALLRTAALASLCAMELSSVSCYVAYREEKMTLDPILAKGQAHVEALREWQRERPLHLSGIRAERVNLRQIRLGSDSGRGHLDLRRPDGSAA